jgi:hypothetical protein
MVVVPQKEKGTATTSTAAILARWNSRAKISQGYLQKIRRHGRMNLGRYQLITALHIARSNEYLILAARLGRTGEFRKPISIEARAGFSDRKPTGPFVSSQFTFARWGRPSHAELRRAAARSPAITLN